MNINKKWLVITVVIFIILYWILEVGDGWSFWSALFLGWIFSRNKQKANSVLKENLNNYEESKKEKEINLNNTKENEAHRVRKEAEKIKEHAMKTGVPQLVSSLYHEKIRYYHSWIKKTPRDYVPEMVTDSKEVQDKKSGKKYILLTMNGREYKFTHSEGSYEDINWADLEMFLDEKKVLHVNESVSYNEWGIDYRANSVDAFIDGDWVKDFKELDKELKKAEQEREREEFENPDEIAKLKKDFGIQ